MTATGTQPDQTTHPAARFIPVMFEPDDLVEIRLIKDGVPAIRGYLPAGEIETHIDWLTERNRNGFNIYIGANPRKRKGGKAEDVAFARCLFADLDNTDLAHALMRFGDSTLPAPTAIIESGHGVHFWWRFDDPIQDLGEWTKRMTAVIAVATICEAMPGRALSKALVNFSPKSTSSPWIWTPLASN